MKFIAIFFACVCITTSADSQAILGQKILMVEGYSVNTVGYPGKIVPVGQGKFAYTEFWTEGQGRKFPGYYLQGYNETMSEEWFAPVNDQGAAQLKILDIFKLKKYLVVVGNQYNPPLKREIAHARFFSFDGKPKTGVVPLASYDKKAKKGFEDELAISADSTKLLWWGQNPAAAAKSRQYFFSVFGDDGQAAWKKKLFIPHAAEGYVVDQVKVDGKGNIYLLLIFEKYTNTPKDTINLPILVRYDFRESKFAEYKIDLTGSSIPVARIHINQQGELCFVAVVSDGGAGGFRNGEKYFGASLPWNKLLFKKFEITRELRLAKEYAMDIPESWVKKYGTNGANFSRFDFLESGSQLFWIAEEFYTQEHNEQNQFLYYDIGIIALDMNQGVISWATSFEKRQRDYNSGRMLSYIPGFANGKLRFVYLTERGAGGFISCTSVDAGTGEPAKQDLVQNKKEDFLFFPKRSSMVGGVMYLMGVGNPASNEYKLIKVGF